MCKMSELAKNCSESNYPARGFACLNDIENNENGVTTNVFTNLHMLHAHKELSHSEKHCCGLDCRGERLAYVSGILDEETVVRFKDVMYCSALTYIIANEE